MEEGPGREDVLLNSREAAEFLRASRAKLYRLIRAGDIDGHKVGGTWLFYRRELVDYVEHQRIRGGRPRRRRRG